MLRASTDAKVVAALFARRAEASAARVEARRKLLLEVLPELTRKLVERGARRVWLFGSLAWGTAHEASDIDLAAEGLAADDLLRLQGELLLQSPGRIDLVRIEEAPPALARRIRAHGKLLHG